MENRCQDNSSPEPTANNQSSSYVCYKTPNCPNSTVNLYAGFGHAYPTPPSDSDNEVSFVKYSNYSSNASIQKSVNSHYYMTPRLGAADTFSYRYVTSPVDRSIYPVANLNYDHSTSSQSFEGRQQSTTHESETNKENESLEKAANSRRFKRRSRTTYTKKQVRTTILTTIF
jgi:hypothetical protein